MKQEEEKKDIKKYESPFESIKVKCHRCEYEWNFAGQKLKFLGSFPIYAQCPQCHTYVKVIEPKKRELKW